MIETMVEAVIDMYYSVMCFLGYHKWIRTLSGGFFCANCHKEVKKP